MMYGEHPFPERFAAAAKDEFAAVEYLFPYDYPARELKGWLQQRGLVQVRINAPPGNWAAGERGLACLPGKQGEFRVAINTALEYAQTLDCARVHVMAGVQPDGVERAAMRGVFMDNLAWAAELAAPAHTELMIEPINTRDMPGYSLNRQDEDGHFPMARCNGYSSSGVDRLSKRLADCSRITVHTLRPQWAEQQYLYSLVGWMGGNPCRRDTTDAPGWDF